jgi:hypothetical protein
MKAVSANINETSARKRLPLAPTGVMLLTAVHGKPRRTSVDVGAAYRRDVQVVCGGVLHGEHVVVSDAPSSLPMSISASAVTVRM